jgi:hypothetical protein
LRRNEGGSGPQIKKFNNLKIKKDGIKLSFFLFFQLKWYNKIENKSFEGRQAYVRF